MLIPPAKLTNMSAAAKKELVSEEDYLAGELTSNIKHEFMGGVVYAMSGGSNAHQLIASNALGILYGKLRGQPCRPYNSDTKIRIRSTSLTRYYYPDVSVICRSNPRDGSFQDDPVVVMEVLSPSTRRIDEGEKREAYQTIASLCVYLMVEQDLPTVVAYRRSGVEFVREIYEGLSAIVPLPEINAELPLAELYESMNWNSS